MAASVGGLSNIDVNTIVTQLMTVERQPLQAMQKSLSAIQTRLSAFGKLQSQLSAFQDAAKALARDDTWNATKATSSDENAARATAGTDAVPGTYSLVVNHLAQRQAVAGPSVPGATAGTVLGTGTLTIQLGTWDSVGGTFTDDASRAAVDVQIPAGATMAQARDAINAAKAGVSASLVDDGNGARLVIRSDATGASNAFRISATGDAGVTALAFDPRSPAATGTSMTLTPRDAEAVVDGLTVRSATNKLEDVIAGVVVDLRKADPGKTVDIEVATDNEALRTSVQKFVSAWNDLNRTISEQTKYDPSSKVAGALQGNGTVVSAQRQLRAILTSAVPGAGLQRLSDAGIEFQRDGSLSIKESKFGAALATPDRLRELFAANGADAATDGLARRFGTLLTSMLGVDGAISSAADGLRGQQERINDRQEAFELRMTLVEARLRRQYTALDSQLSQYGSASSLFTSKFG